MAGSLMIAASSLAGITNRCPREILLSSIQSARQVRCKSGWYGAQRQRQRRIRTSAAIDDFVYEVTSATNTLISDEVLSGSISFGTLALIYLGGNVTAFSPCSLSMLPITVGYISAFSTDQEERGERGDETEDGQTQRGDGDRQSTSTLALSAAFAAGLATTLAALGFTAATAGKAYGQVGSGLPIAASLFAMVMGLNLLEVIPIQFPSFFRNFDPRSAQSKLPAPALAYLTGATFALAASPCSTPILATLLAYVATASSSPLVGASLLFAYTLGYSTPLLVAAAGAGNMQRVVALRKYSAVITPISGTLLLAGGTYSLLNRLI